MLVTDKEIIGVWKRTDNNVRYEFDKVRVLIGSDDEAEVVDYAIRQGAKSQLIINGISYVFLSMSRIRFVIYMEHGTVEFLREHQE